MAYRRSTGAMLITEPHPSERLFEMSVRLAREELVTMPGYTLFPMVTVRANVETGEVCLAASMKSKRVVE